MRRPKVDMAEAALRERLAPGRYREGDRLPPELELAEALGISRGTLRSALERLEQNGEIVRRQGSGTFVGRVAMPPVFSEGLEVLRPYSSLAALQGRRLTAMNLRIESIRPPGYAREALWTGRSTRVKRIERTLLANNQPAAHMRDFLHPDVDLASEELEASLTSGQMVLDLLLEQGLAVGLARTQIRPRLVEPNSAAGRALDATRVTAALETTETIYDIEGSPMQYSVNVFAPGSIDLHVMRALDRSES